MVELFGQGKIVAFDFGVGSLEDKIKRRSSRMLLDTLEEWLSLIIGVVFVGFVFLVIALIFRSPVVWLCLGLLAVILFIFPILRTLLTLISIQISRRRRDNEKGLESNRGQQQVVFANKQREVSVLKSKPKQLTIEVKRPSLDDPEVQTYVPPGLPPELFL
jgi:type VI protein secretion system component VasK